VQSRSVAVRVVALVFGMLTVAAACSSSGKSASPTTTTAPATSSTTGNPLLTQNSIPYVVGARMGLDGGWQVTVTKVHLHFAPAGLKPAPAGKQYVAVDIIMNDQGPASHTVNASEIFTMVDDSHDQLYPITVPGAPNGIDGKYVAGTTRTGRLVFEAPVGERLGMVLYGPRIGTQVSDFTIDPPTVPDAP